MLPAAISQAGTPARPAFVIGYPKMSSSLPSKERTGIVNGSQGITPSGVGDSTKPLHLGVHDAQCVYDILSHLQASFQMLDKSMNEPLKKLNNMLSTYPHPTAEASMPDVDTKPNSTIMEQPNCKAATNPVVNVAVSAVRDSNDDHCWNQIPVKGRKVFRVNACTVVEPEEQPKEESLVPAGLANNLFYKLIGVESDLTPKNESDSAAVTAYAAQLTGAGETKRTRRKKRAGASSKRAMHAQSPSSESSESDSEYSASSSESSSSGSDSENTSSSSGSDSEETTASEEAESPGFTMSKVDSAADASILGKNAPASEVSNLVGPNGHKVRATYCGRLNGILTCAVTGRHVPLSVGAYGGTGNESTIWTTHDINAAGGWVTFGPNGVQYMYLPNRGRFYLTTDGHAIVAHPKPGESPSSAAKRARTQAFKAGWKPSHVMKRQSNSPRAPSQRREGGAAPSR